MTKILMFLVLFVGLSAQAATIPSAVLKAAATRKQTDIRAVVVKTAGDNPCDGGYEIKIQVKKADMNGPDAPASYHWETVNTLSSDAKGNILEVCYE